MKWQEDLQSIVTIFNGIEQLMEHYGLIYVAMEYYLPLVQIYLEAFHKMYFKEQPTKWGLERIMFMVGQFGHLYWS